MDIYGGYDQAWHGAGLQLEIVPMPEDQHFSIPAPSAALERQIQGAGGRGGARAGRGDIAGTS